MVVSVALTAAVLETQGSVELTFLGWRVLVVVADDAVGVRLSELADRLRISRPSTTKLVKRLSLRGLVATVPDAADGRGRRLRLTPAGARVREGVILRRRELIGRVLAQEVSRDLAVGLEEIEDRLYHWPSECLADDVQPSPSRS